MTVFAFVALVLAAVGLYAATAFSVTRRTQEIGVRMALGSPAGAVVWLFAKRASLPLGIGLVIGLAGALGVGRLLQHFLILRDESNTDFHGMCILGTSLPHETQ